MDREKLVETLLLGLATSAIFIVIFIIIFMLKESFPVFLEYGFDFVFGTLWKPAAGSFGIFPMIVATILVSGLALLIAAPLGVACAIFLAEYAPLLVRNVVKPVVEMLVGIPSVIIGFFGLMVIVPFLRAHLGGYGLCLLAGGITLAIMTLPHVVSISEDAIRAVPRSYREASLALGATKWTTIRRVILPSAKSGVLAAIILGMGRAVGETMAVLMVVGNPETPWIPTSLLDPVRPLTSTIILEIEYALWGSMHERSLFAIGVVLFVIVAILNLIAVKIIKKGVLP
ncbi:MAG: ABC-type phosphate transport system [Candidatus Alkanophagales archaeon MCA70_species_2]|nr:ABC-type phosphate transport system [Candidatus Alkanophaga liquidiphilum]